MLGSPCTGCAHVPLTSHVSLSAGDALGALLTTESLLLAVVGLAVTISSTTGRIPKLPIPATMLAGGAVALLAAVGAGAGVAWSELYLSPFPSDWSNRVIAVALLTAVAAEPI